MGAATISKFTFNAGTDTLKAWTYLPNGVTDSTPGNDSVVSVFTILAQPLANAGTNSQICSGNSTSIGAVAVSGNAYAWTSKPSGFSSSSSKPLVKPSITTMYYLTETILAGACSKTDSVIITVNPLPAVNIGKPRSVCLGASTTLGAASVSGDSYNWLSNPTGFTSANANPDVSPKETTVYYLLETNAAKCSNTDSVKVTVNTLPVPYAGKPATVCNGTTTSIGSAGIGTDTYIWSSDPAGFKSTKPNPTVLLNITTTFILTQTNALGCSAKDSVLITANALPEAMWTGTLDKCELALIPKSTKNKTYLWHFGNGDSSVALGPVYNYKSKGLYNVALMTTNTNGCKAEYDSVISVSKLCISVVQLLADNNFHLAVFPNPFETATVISYQLSKTSNTQISLFDITGKKISIITSQTQIPGQYQLDINAEKYHLQPGMYLLKFMVDGEVTSRHVVKIN